jgi:plastocyanin
MDGRPAFRRAGIALAAVVAAVVTSALIAAPATAEVRTEKFRVPIAVGGYEVLQSVAPAPHPNLDGFVTGMRADVVNANGRRVPIQRLMLHHIVFANLARPDLTCDSIVAWDSETAFAGRERFFAAGEERARMVLPPGYGYRLRPSDPWGLLYMVMNHRAEPDEAFIQYEVTVDDDPALTPVDPYWLDVRNCRADPVYNVPGTGPPGSTHTTSADATIVHSGRIVAAGGHVHGGALGLSLTQPACSNRVLGVSIPTWGPAEHAFYNVRPILHEPGPINMSAFTTRSGIPVRAGETLRLNSVYDNSRPHARVMGIMIAYVAPDDGVGEGCAPLPADIANYSTDRPGRSGPVPFRVPLTGLDADGAAVAINRPPGNLTELRSGATITVSDAAFSPTNVSVRRGARLRWRFDGYDLHNLTLANGPEAIGSPNLNGGRVFTHRFRRAGTYRLFCALHPVRMSERVVVRGG